MTVPLSDNLESLDRAMRQANLRQELEEHSFYYSATAIEKGMSPGETTAMAEAKRQLIDDAVAVAPLAAHIVRGSRIACADINDKYSREGPVTCFRVHEILRKTRRHPEARILIDEFSVPREELLKMYRMLTPNTNLEPLSPYTLYSLPRILLAALVGGIVTGGWAGREQSPEVWMDFRAAIVGAGLVAATMSLLGQFAVSRDVTRTAPWNAALYNDVNLIMYRQNPALLYLARTEFMERNHLVKGGLNGRRYHERAQAIESGAYIETLQRRREQFLAGKARG
jgi:hypothetical protein